MSTGSSSQRRAHTMQYRTQSRPLLQWKPRWPCVTTPRHEPNHSTPTLTPTSPSHPAALLCICARRSLALLSPCTPSPFVTVTDATPCHATLRLVSSLLSSPLFFFPSWPPDPSPTALCAHIHARSSRLFNGCQKTSSSNIKLAIPPETTPRWLVGSLKGWPQPSCNAHAGLSPHNRCWWHTVRSVSVPRRRPLYHLLDIQHEDSSISTGRHIQSTPWKQKDETACFPPAFTPSSLTGPDTPHPRVAFAGTDSYGPCTCDRQDPFPFFFFLFSPFPDRACCLGSVHL